MSTNEWTPKADSPTVSVLLPVRDARQLILGAVRSILEQSLPDFELIVLDDGSRDGSIDVLSRLTDARLRIVTGASRQGLAARLNQGIDLARGRYIARMDADDLSFPQRLEAQARFLDEHPDVDLVAARVIVFQDATNDPMGSLPYQQFHDAIVRRPWRGMYMPHPTWMGRAEWFRRWKYCYPEAVRAEDQELLLRALPSSRYHCLSEILVAYRQGSFNYRKTLLARRSLLAAQLRIFGRRGSYADLIKSLAATAVKVATDTMAAIPGCDRVFFYRMSYPTEQEAKKQLKDLLCRLYGNVE